MADFNIDDGEPIKPGTMGVVIAGLGLRTPSPHLPSGEFTPAQLLNLLFTNALDRAAADNVQKMLAKKVGREGVTNYEEIKVLVYDEVTKPNAVCRQPIVVTSIFMELLETRMSPKELRYSVDYMAAVVRVSVTYQQWETFMTPTEGALLAVCGLGLCQPDEVRTPKWVYEILARDLSLLEDEEARARMKVHIKTTIVPSLTPRMLYYAPDDFKKTGGRPYQCFQPFKPL